MNSSVNSIALNGNDVYVGGYFTEAGGVSANHIAKWNGSSWSALGSGVGGSTDEVFSIALSGNDVYAGGNFTTAGGVNANNIAKWNGSSWSALASGFERDVYSIAINGNNVYVGGWFKTAGGVNVNNIAKWNGSSWSALGSGFSKGSDSSYVYSIALSGNDVYAGGNFTKAGGVSAKNIAKWNGIEWNGF